MQLGADLMHLVRLAPGKRKRLTGAANVASVRAFLRGEDSLYAH